LKSIKKSRLILKHRIFNPPNQNQNQNQSQYPSAFFILLFLVFSLTLNSNVLVCAEAKKKVTVKGIDRIWGDTEGDITFLEGELLATQDKTVIYASRAEMNKETKVAIFRDGVKLVQEEVTITGDKLEIDFDRDLGVFFGDVYLEREETKDEHGEIEKERIELTCACLEMNTETKDFTAQDNVMMKHTDFTATAFRLVYLDEEEVMTFSGNSYLVRKQEEVRGEEIRIELQKKVFEVKGGAEVCFEVDEDEKENNEDSEEKTEEDVIRTEPGADESRDKEQVEPEEAKGVDGEPEAEEEDEGNKDATEETVDEVKNNTNQRKQSGSIR